MLAGNSYLTFKQFHGITLFMIKYTEALSLMFIATGYFKNLYTTGSSGCQMRSPLFRLLVIRILITAKGKSRNSRHLPVNSLSNRYRQVSVLFSDQQGTETLLSAKGRVQVVRYFLAVGNL
jgi:hypothetical protein